MLRELRDTSSIPVAFAGVVLVSGAAFVPLNADCIKRVLSKDIDVIKSEI